METMDLGSSTSSFTGMTMGEFDPQPLELDADDLAFFMTTSTTRELKDLSSTPSTSSNENSRYGSQESEEAEPDPKRSRVEPSPWLDDIFDGLDLPDSIVEHRIEEEEKNSKEDCTDYYGQIEWCDEIIRKFEAQLNDADDEVEKAIKQTQEEATAILEEHKLEEESRRLFRKNALKEDKLKRRMLSQANKEKPLFCCFICNKAFTSEDSVQAHVNEAHLRLDKRHPFKCKHCHMRFAHAPNLYRHMQDIHSGTTFKCPHCPYDFKQKTTLDIHLSRDHAPKTKEEQKAIFCGICQNAFTSEAEVKRHSYYCKKKEEIALKRKEAKKAQLFVPVGQNTIVSPAFSTCSSVSSTASSNGRPTKDKSCPWCLDVFASMQSRTRHISRKHPEKVNDPESQQATYFKVDSPDLPYACLDCGKRFASSSSLQTHKKRIHEKKLDHPCEKCGKAYPLRSELRKHLRRVHNVTEIEAQDMTTF